MTEWLITFFENLGLRKVPEQIEYLLTPGNIPFAIWESLYAALLATLLAYAIGLPLGIILVTGEEHGIRPLPRPLMRVLNVVINLLRSVPFLILMVMVMPLSRLILGTSVGTAATIVPLTVAAAPYVARLVEASLREMDRGIIEAAQAMGCSPWQIVTKVMLPECKPALINGATNASITVLSRCHGGCHRRRRPGCHVPDAGLHPQPIHRPLCGGDLPGHSGPDRTKCRYRSVCENRQAYQ